MPLSLIAGPPNSGRVEEVIKRLRGDLARDPVLVVPRAADAERFEQMLCAGGQATVGVSITTFAWLVEDLARALGLRLPPALSRPQRLALVRAAAHAAPLSVLARSAHHPGFATALERLIGELQGSLIEPEDLARHAEDLEEGGYERELASLYATYVELRDRAGRSDPGSLATAVLAASLGLGQAWGGRPLYLYGFDDLTAAQRELLAALARVAEVTVAVTYDDREALSARAGLMRQLEEELGGTVAVRLEHDPRYAERGLLAHLDRNLFEVSAGVHEADGGVVMLESAGALGEAEAIGAEIASLLASGEAAPDDIAIVLRNPARGGPLIGRVLARFGIPAAVEAEMPLARTAVGHSLSALCRAELPGGSAADLLAHLRADIAFPATIADQVERRIARGEVRTPDDVFASWQTPPRHLSMLRGASDGPGRLRALATIARELAEGAHHRTAPLAGEAHDDVAPLDVIELRAASVAEELLEELASTVDLAGCEPPDLPDALEAIAGASVRLWTGPSEGRVRILDPYRARAQPATHLFCASLQEGEFPSAGPVDPLLSEERRGALGLPELRRQDQALEERYLFHACISRPTRRLYLSWRSSDDDGAPLARSPFIDEVLDLIAPSPEAAEGELKVSRGLDRSVLRPEEAPTPRELARALACRVQSGDWHQALAGVPEAAAREVIALLERTPDPAVQPGPLQVPEVLTELSERHLLSASSLESWLGCSYRWFVDHELKPERLAPTPDPLWVGGVVHAALARLYANPPGAEGIPRPADVSAWRRRFGEVLEEAAAEAGGVAGPERATALARARAQVEAFLEEEAGLETDLRPRADLLERSFGFEEEGDPGPLLLGDGVGLRGKIDRIDLAPDGAAVIRDYKLSREVPGVTRFEDSGTLQIQLYMLAARDRLALEPIAGLYQPLGGTANRRPRGIARKGDDRLAGLPLVRTDPVEDDRFDDELDRTRERARVLAGEMRAGAIDRRPLGGRCPSYCSYQAICRLERAVGAVGDGDAGEESE